MDNVPFFTKEIGSFTYCSPFSQGTIRHTVYTSHASMLMHVSNRSMSPTVCVFKLRKHTRTILGLATWGKTFFVAYFRSISLFYFLPVSHGEGYYTNIYIN